VARIPNEELERLKVEISVERLVEAAGVALKTAGKALLGRCPFHEDREASLVVTPTKNLWHCFDVTASYGIEGFTADHLAAFKQHGIECVLIAYDRDEAGDRAAEKLAKQLMAEGLDCYRIQFPHGMDANEYALKVTPAAKSLGLAIRKAQWRAAVAEAPGRAQPVCRCGGSGYRGTLSVLSAFVRGGC
jgi:DNA primase